MPQALTFSLTNIFKFMSYLSPLLITFFMIMYSILTSNILKGLIFMAGLVIITFINYLLKNTVKSPQSELASPFCNTLPAPFTFRSENSIFNSPSTSSTIIAFTASFLIYPMFLYGHPNYPLMVFLIALTTNGFAQEQDKNIVYRSKTEIDFESVELKGDFVKPEGSIVIDRQRARFSPMIKLRTNFSPEMALSIKEIE